MNAEIQQTQSKEDLLVQSQVSEKPRGWKDIFLKGILSSKKISVKPTVKKVSRKKQKPMAADSPQIKDQMESASAIMKFESTPDAKAEENALTRDDDKVLQEKVLSNSKPSDIEAFKTWMVANCSRHEKTKDQAFSKKKVYKKVMTTEEVNNIASVLKACSKLKQVKVAMQVLSSLDDHVIPKKVQESLLNVCLDCGELEQASIIMKQAEQVVVIDSDLKDRQLELFISFKGNDHLNYDMRPDVPEFLSMFHKETFNPNAQEFVPVSTPNRYLEENKENFEQMQQENNNKLINQYKNQDKKDIYANKHCKNFSHGFKNKHHY